MLIVAAITLLLVFGLALACPIRGRPPFAPKAESNVLQFKSPAPTHRPAPWGLRKHKSPMSANLPSGGMAA